MIELSRPTPSLQAFHYRFFICQTVHVCHSIGMLFFGSHLVPVELLLRLQQAFGNVRYIRHSPGDFNGVAELSSKLSSHPVFSASVRALAASSICVWPLPGKMVDQDKISSHCPWLCRKQSDHLTIQTEARHLYVNATDELTKIFKRQHSSEVKWMIRLLLKDLLGTLACTKCA